MVDCEEVLGAEEVHGANLELPDGELEALMLSLPPPAPPPGGSGSLGGGGGLVTRAPGAGGARRAPGLAALRDPGALEGWAYHDSWA